jgi:hypothetical protein
MKTILLILFSIASYNSFSQGNPPWERPLMIARSTDGITFTNNSIFQDSSGVPSAVKWKGDTLVSVFQWFRQPQGSPSWDKVAVKFSYDNGVNWTQPLPIIINSFPVNFQRPFDPTLAVLNNDSLRIYFSSSNGIPSGGLDSTINTYSAVSTDGINYIYEPGARFDHPSNKVIDPAVIFFNGSWHYSAPIGAPQDGAYHCTSNDGLNFTLQGNYLSNSTHNWTGNFLINNPSVLRFYGSGAHIWFNESNDGINWLGYTSTNIQGGDPTVVKTGISNYTMIYVGHPYTLGANEINIPENISIAPNPFSDYFQLTANSETSIEYKIYSIDGKTEMKGNISNNQVIHTSGLRSGIYILCLKSNSFTKYFKIIK